MRFFEAKNMPLTVVRVPLSAYSRNTNYSVLIWLRHTHKKHAADIHKPNGSWKSRMWIRFDSRQNAAGLENVPQSAYWLRNACFPLTSSHGAGCATDTRYIACGHTLRRRLSLQSLTSLATCLMENEWRRSFMLASGAKLIGTRIACCCCQHEIDATEWLRRKDEVARWCAALRSLGHTTAFIFNAIHADGIAVGVAYNYRSQARTL